MALVNPCTSHTGYSQSVQVSKYFLQFGVKYFILCLADVGTSPQLCLALVYITLGSQHYAKTIISLVHWIITFLEILLLLIIIP